jgi:DNA-binding MarR family transcriptional regulator
MAKKPPTARAIARVLAYLAARGAATIPEIAEGITSGRSTIRATVKHLVQGGQVEPLGTSLTNARCYDITPAGRLALAAQPES